MNPSAMNQPDSLEETRSQLSEAGREIRDRACEAQHAVEEKAAELKQAFTEGTAEVWKSVRDAGHDVKERAAVEFSAARDAAGNYVEGGRVRLEEFGAAAERRIREQPLTSLLIAVGAGFLLGAIWLRR